MAMMNKYLCANMEEIKLHVEKKKIIHIYIWYHLYAIKRNLVKTKHIHNRKSMDHHWYIEGRTGLWLVINTLVISIIVDFTRVVYLCIRNVFKIICDIFVKGDFTKINKPNFHLESLQFCVLKYLNWFLSYPLDCPCIGLVYWRNCLFTFQYACFHFEWHSLLF